MALFYTGSDNPNVRYDDLHRPWDTLTGANTQGSDIEGLIDQTYNKKLDRYEFSGNQDIDATLIGSRYTITNLTFSFPTSGKFYADQGYPANAEPAFQIEFNAQQQTAVRYALDLVSRYTNLTFTEAAETKSDHANLRYSQTSYSGVPSAYANFPSASEQAGDVWFGRTNQPFYLTPQPGNWGQATVMHETGHTLGLKHGHQDYTDLDLTGYIDGNKNGDPRHGSVALPSDHDGQDWSLMTYRSDPGNSVQFEGDSSNQPQTYMQDDIAALQYLYGANFTTEAGNTVYSWNPNTGVQSIDGVQQAVPTANKISMTLWDGNGTDTYDLSNYKTNLDINLNPGEFSTFSTAQLVNHRAYSHGTAIAEGNVANALLYDGDKRSLIENAIGGVGNDKIVGNQAKNTLNGGDGNDTLTGGKAADTFFFAGQSGKDTVTDFGKGGADVVRIDAKKVDDFSDLTVKSDGGDGSLVSWRGGSVDLLHVATTSVNAGMFAFGSLQAASVFAPSGAFAANHAVFAANFGHAPIDMAAAHLVLA